MNVLQRRKHRKEEYDQSINRVDFLDELCLALLGMNVAVITAFAFPILCSLFFSPHTDSGWFQTIPGNELNEAQGRGIPAGTSRPRMGGYVFVRHFDCVSVSSSTKCPSIWGLCTFVYCFSIFVRGDGRGLINQESCGRVSCIEVRS